MPGSDEGNEPKPPVAAGGSPAKAPAAAAGTAPPAAGTEFDFAIEEIAPTEQLKEGFTGQER